MVRRVPRHPRVKLYCRADAGVSLAPSFDRRERYTLADPSATNRECLLPVVALTLHEDGEVVAAYPHTAGDDHRGVDEALALLESGDGPTVDAEPGADSREAADCRPTGGRPPRTGSYSTGSKR